MKWGNWPAYSLGKYFFDRRSDRKVVRAGIHIEKGIDPANARAYGGGKGRYFGMTPDWAWFGFLEDMKSGRLETALRTIEERSGQAVEVVVEPSFPLDEPKVHETFGHHRFVTTDGGRLRLVEESSVPNKLLGIGKVTSLEELGERFKRATSDEPWTWINVFVSAAVSFASEPPPGAGPSPWTGSDFWHRVLEPLAGWIR